jgi:hypothetical protein
LTDNEDDVSVIGPEDVPEEGKFDQDIDDGFNIAGGFKAN